MRRSPICIASSQLTPIAHRAVRSWSTHTLISSMYTQTPSKSSRHWYTVQWKTSGAEQILIGSRIYRYLPNGVLKVVIMDDFFFPTRFGGSRLWHPSWRNTLLRQVHQVSPPSLVFWKCPRLIAMLRYFGSMKIRTSPFFYSVMTIEWAQSVSLSSYFRGLAVSSGRPTAKRFTERCIYMQCISKYILLWPAQAMQKIALH